MAAASAKDTTDSLLVTSLKALETRPTGLVLIVLGMQARVLCLVAKQSLLSYTLAPHWGILRKSPTTEL